MNLVDKIISIFSPSVALKRAQNRYAMSVLDSQRRYEGASKGRRTANWKTNNASANTELRYDISTLRNRSRDLTRNNPYAKRAIQAIANNTIGSGIRPKASGLSASAERNLKAEWMRWAESTACDFDDKMNFYGLQKLVMRTIAESGDCLVVKRMVNRSLQLQVLEGDHIDHTKDGPNDMGYCSLGVQFNDKGKKIGYWIYPNHPGDTNRANNLVSEFVKADKVIHIFEVLRPGQSRGVPFGVSTIIRLRDFDEFEDAQLVRQKIAACFSVFVTDASGGMDYSSSDADIAERVEPGIIEILPAGKQVSFASPPKADGYGEYSLKILQAIAVGFGVPYEILTGDLSNVNYSSGRMGWIEFQRSVEDWQDNMLIPILCQGVWNWWVDHISIKGVQTDNLVVTWTTPRRLMIDPDKEVKGIERAVRAGLMSWQEAIRQMGYDPDDVSGEFKQDYAMFDANGMKVTVDLRNELQQETQTEEIEPN